MEVRRTKLKLEARVQSPQPAVAHDLLGGAVAVLALVAGGDAIARAAHVVVRDLLGDHHGVLGELERACQESAISHQPQPGAFEKGRPYRQ